MVENLELGKRIKANGFELSSIGESLMPSALGYRRVYILSEGSGRYILGQKFGNAQAPCAFVVEPAILFGFMPEESARLYELAMGNREDCEGEEIDLRPLDHGVRHPLVMRRFSELEKGKCLYIINDHDPLPLYFQMAMAFPNRVGWEYVEFGGEFWKIRIRRLS